MTFDLYRARVLREVEAQAPALAPDGDWPAVMLCDGPGSDRAVVEMPLEREDCGAVLAVLLARLEPERVATVTSGWKVDDPDRVEPGAEGRYECVVVLVADRSDVEVWWAPIRRRAGAAPTLDAWEPWPVESGRLFDPIVEVLHGHG